MLIREFERKVLAFDDEKEMFKALEVYKATGWDIKSYGAAKLTENEFLFKAERWIQIKN